MTESRRQPHDMKGLLNFCTELTVQEDAPNPHTPMDSERQEFLRNVLENMSISNAKRMAEVLKYLHEVNKHGLFNFCSDEDVISIEGHLKMLLSIIDDIDDANDFVKMGGIDIILLSVYCEAGDIGALSCEILSEISQNNPKAQEEMLNRQVLPKLFHILDSNASSSLKEKALYAVSSLVRNFTPATLEFWKTGGFSVVMRAMSTNSDTLFIKSVFLISSLLREHARLKAAYSLATEESHVKVKEENVIKNNLKIFLPTNEWKEIHPDETVLAGLHYRMNLETGCKEAKLVEGDDGTEYYKHAQKYHNQKLVGALYQQRDHARSETPGGGGVETDVMVVSSDGEEDLVLPLGYTQLLASRLCSSERRDSPLVDPCREHCTSALLQLCHLDQSAVSVCRSIPQLLDSLKRRQGEIRGREECQEESEYLGDLLRLVT